MDNLPTDVATYWKTVLDTVQEALLILSPEGQIISMNRAAEAVTGYTVEELVGENCTLLDCDGCKLYGRGPGKDWCKLFVDGRVLSKRCHITSKSGERVTVLKRATVLEDAEGRTLGAVETLNDITEMIQKENEIVSLRRSLTKEEGFHGLIGHPPVMQRLYELTENIAQSEAPVLITGESGTGKELVARAVHKLSLRSDKPFIKVNCAALNQNLLETELFGHVKGAFTGAGRDRTGRFEAAHTGGIFLDEVGDVPLTTQVKLLRVLQEKEIERVGDHKSISVDVRFITATNRDLSQLMARGEFREDFFYRINVVPINLPPLRERAEDIPILAQGFMDRLSARTGKPIEGFSAKSLRIFLNYTWPGNVRELKNAIEYAFVLCGQGVIEPEHLPERIRGNGAPVKTASVKSGDSEREELIRALKQADGNQSRVARLLGVSRMTVYNRIKKLGIDMRRDLA